MRRKGPITRLVRASLLVGIASGPFASLALGQHARRELVDGLPVYVQTRAKAELEFRAYCRAGSTTAADPRIAPLTAAWIAIGGTQSLPGREFEAAMAELDLAVHAWADRDLLSIEARAQPGRFRPSARLFADLVMYPAFTPSDASRARAAAAAPLAIDPAVAMVRRSLSLDVELAEPRPEGSNRITRTEVVAHHRRRVGIDTCVIVVTGPLDGIDVARELNAAFVGFRRAGEAMVAVVDGEPAGRGVSVALRELSPGRSRLVIARYGLHRSHPDWLALEVGITAGLLGPAAGGGGTARFRVVPAILGPDLLLLDARVSSGGLKATFAAHREAFDELMNRSLRTRALERARDYVGRALVPPADAAFAATAHALLEAFGLPGGDPNDRYERLLALDRATVIRAVARHLR